MHRANCSPVEEHPWRAPRGGALGWLNDPLRGMLPSARKLERALSRPWEMGGRAKKWDDVGHTAESDYYRNSINSQLY